MSLETTLYVVGGLAVAACLAPAGVVLVNGWREHRRQQAAAQQSPPPVAPVIIAPALPDLRPAGEVGSKRVIDRLPEEVKDALVYQIRIGTAYRTLEQDLRRRGFRLSAQAISAYARQGLGLRRRRSPFTKVNHQEVLRG